MNKKRINIGFDIGITSVGWAIVDEDNNIIDRGVRLFNELKDSKDGSLANENRRKKRGLRRLIRRKRNRKDDFIKMITNEFYDIFKIQKFDSFEETKSNFIKQILLSDDNDVLGLIFKGLEKEIEPKKLLRVLYYYLAHRGYSYKTFEMLEKEDATFDTIKDNSKYLEFADWLLKNDNADRNLIEEKANKSSYKENFKTVASFIKSIKNYNSEKDYHGLFPSYVQKKLYDKYQYFRGNKKNTTFSTQEWWKEIESLLSNQSYLNQEFKNKYEDLFFRKREFADGPGSEKSPSNYGLWRINENGKVEKVAERLWDLTIGECSVYPNQKRADKKSMSAELSNILSQLNTLSIKNNGRNNHKLTEEEKKKIIYEVISKSKSLDLKTIAKVTQTSVEDIFHYPTKSKKSKEGNNKDVCNFDEMSNSKKLFKILEKHYLLNDFDSILSNLDNFNKIIQGFSCYPDQPAKIENFLKEKKNELNLTDQIIKKIVNESKVDSKLTSSMSLKALNQYIKEELRDNGLTVNQKYKKIIDDNQFYSFKFGDSKYMNINCLDNEILSPTTKCSFRETLKVFNKILKRFVYNGEYYLKNIIMEMPTEWNSVDERKLLTDIKNHNENLINVVKENYGYEANGSHDKVFRKLSLLHKQNNLDIYTGENINPAEVINNDRYCEIDHIVPYSLSYDDSWHNKVLTLSKNNQEKGQRTPKEFLGSKFFIQEKKWKELYLDDSSEFYDKRKYELLTIDLNNENEFSRRSIGFIGRNLADTRYACRLVNQAFRSWLANMNNKIINEGYSPLCSLNDEIHLLNVNGSVTQRFRSPDYLNLKKNRDTDYSHHAIDATICAILGNSDISVGKLIWYQKNSNSDDAIEEYSQSKFCRDSNKEKLEKFKENIPWNQLSESVKNHKVKFSFKLQKKSSMPLWGDSLVSVKKNIHTDEYQEFSKVEFMKLENFAATEKEMNSLIKLYGNMQEPKYPDTKLWMDILKAYDEGKKLSNLDDQSKKINPFKLYMDKYYEINGLEKPTNYTHLFLERDGYKYKVKSIKKYNNINSFYPANNKQFERDKNNLFFGAKTALEWKEIRLYMDKKGKFRVIPIRVDIMDNNINQININKLDELLKIYNIDTSSNYFPIHYGTIMVKINNIKDIWKVVSHSFEQNKLEIKEVYKKNEKRTIKSIIQLMKEFQFCTIDVLGNVSIINTEDLFKKKEI